MVCKKVEEKGRTTYNEVADELVHAVIEERRREQPSDATTRFDEKNIRRRVYDALNVLMAMDIIYKDKKEISWKGLPTTASQDLEMLHRELSFRQSEVNRKRDALQELLMQQVCFRNLVEHNAKRQGTAMDVTKDNKIPLPFIVVNTSSSAVIQCNMSRDLTDVMFDFSMPFEINDDNTILKRLGLYVHEATLCCREYNEHWLTKRFVFLFATDTDRTHRSSATCYRTTCFSIACSTTCWIKSWVARARMALLVGKTTISRPQSECRKRNKVTTSKSVSTIFPYLGTTVSNLWGTLLHVAFSFVLVQPWIYVL